MNVYKHTHKWLTISKLTGLDVE